MAQGSTAEVILRACRSEIAGSATHRSHSCLLWRFLRPCGVVYNPAIKLILITLVTLVVVMTVGCSSEMSEAELATHESPDSIEQGQYQRAIQAFDKAIQLNPNYALAYVNCGLA